MSRRGGLLNMRNFLNAIKGLPHAEERPRARLEARTASPLLFFCHRNRFPDTLLRREGKSGDPPVAGVRRVPLAVHRSGSAVFTIATGSAMLSEK